MMSRGVTVVMATWSHVFHVFFVCVCVSLCKSSERLQDSDSLGASEPQTCRSEVVRLVLSTLIRLVVT